MDVNQDVLMEVCLLEGKRRKRKFAGTFGECEAWAERQAEQARKEGWEVLHAADECVWRFNPPRAAFMKAAGFGVLPGFELVVGDCDD